MRALRKGEVRLDAVKAREAGIKIRSGQELYVPWEPPGAEAAVSESAAKRWGEVPMLWRGDNVVIINKPADLLVQPDVKGGDSVITRIWGMFGRGRLGFSPAAVHRLDRNTTGVLVAALSGEALRELERLFKERLVVKRYLAVVVGELPGKGVVNAPLLKDEANNIVKVVGGSEKDGKTALTRYKRLSFNGTLSLASIELLTGRTHQARVHMAHLGCPILGDRKYGNFEANRRRREAKRPLLHAFELQFPAGLSGALSEVSGKTFRSELPKDMETLLRKEGLKKEFSGEKREKNEKNLGGEGFENITL